MIIFSMTLPPPMTPPYQITGRLRKMPASRAAAESA